MKTESIWLIDNYRDDGKRYTIKSPGLSKACAERECNILSTRYPKETFKPVEFVRKQQ